MVIMIQLILKENDDDYDDDDEDQLGVGDSNGGFLSGRTWRLRKREQGRTNEQRIAPMLTMMVVFV